MVADQLLAECMGGRTGRVEGGSCHKSVVRGVNVLDGGIWQFLGRLAESDLQFGAKFGAGQVDAWLVVLSGVLAAVHPAVATCGPIPSLLFLPHCYIIFTHTIKTRQALTH